MADGIRIDDSEVRALAADLGRVPAKTLPAVDAVMKRGAQNVKETMRSDAEGHASLPHFPRSITYDRVMGTGIEYEIGPDKDRMQGPLGSILFYGTSRHGPVLDIEVGIREEAPRLEDNLSKVAVGLLGM